MLGEPGSPLAALPLLGAGLALFLWGHHVAAPDLLLISFLAFCLGSALLLFGARFAGELTLPILFLAFAIPFPGVLNNHVTFALQLMNAGVSAWLLNGVGFSVVQEGDMLYFADGTLQVIETCSGLRSMVVLAMVAVGLAGWSPASRLHLVALVASSIGIAWAVNLVRIVVLVLIPELEEPATHAVQGAALFLVGSMAVSAVDAGLRSRARCGARPAAGVDPHSAGAESGEPGRLWRAAVLAVLLGTMLGASLWLPRWSPAEARETPRVSLPERIADWEAIEALKPDARFLGTVRLLRKDYRRYRRGDETVDVFVAYDDRLRRGRSLLSPKHAVPGSGWYVDSRTPAEQGPDGPRVEVVSARTGPRRICALHWYLGADPLLLEFLRALMATDQSPLRRPGGAWVARLSTPVASAEGEERAEERLREFARLLDVGSQYSKGETITFDDFERAR
jgi:EpsI family protein